DHSGNGLRPERNRARDGVGGRWTNRRVRRGERGYVLSLKKVGAAEARREGKVGDVGELLRNAEYSAAVGLNSHGACRAAKRIATSGAAVELKQIHRETATGACGVKERAYPLQRRRRIVHFHTCSEQRAVGLNCGVEIHQQ